MLTLIVFIPLVAAFALLFVAKDNRELIRMVSVGAAGLSFLLSLGLLWAFDKTDPLFCTP